MGISVANSQVVLELAKWIKVLEKLEDEEKEQAHHDSKDTMLRTALGEFRKWFGDDAKVDDNGHPILSKLQW